MKNIKQWQGRWACVGGGSAGLGLILARHLVRQGANVAIVGRDRGRLASAVEDLKALADQCSTKGKIVSFSVDLASSQKVHEQSQPIDSSHASCDYTKWLEWLTTVDLDLAIAAAGKSDRGYLYQLSLDDVRSIFEANVSTSFTFSQHCMESLSRGKGTLVHIGSLAGIVAAPGMGAYSIAKHSVVALSRQLRLELAPKGVHVLLVCPGPVANTEHVGRYDELVKQRELPPEYSEPAGGNKVRSIDAELLARKILQGVQAGTKELVVPGKVRWLAAFGMLFPSFADYMLRKKG
jgi:uncharacterized protein